MYSIKQVTITIAILALLGCGPSEESDSETTTNQGDTQDAPVNKEVTSTRQLVASSDFDFRSEREIRLQVQSFPSEVGKLNVYSHSQFYDESLDTHYPDYSSQIASLIGNTEVVYQLSINDNWNYLLFEWLPMDGLSHERYRKMNLSDVNDYTLRF